MPSPFQTAIAAGLASIRQQIGVSVVYSDGVHTVTIAKAGAADTEYLNDLGNGIVETWTSRDYLVAASDIVLAGVVTRPVKGHTIVETINGVAKTFEILNPPGKQVFEYSDRGQTSLRIHSQQVA